MEETLDSRSVPVLRIAPASLAGCRATLDSTSFRVDEHSIGGILWRVRPDGHFADDFVEADQLFVSVETRAVWLSALHAPGVRSPFRPEASMFFTTGAWLLWHVRLAEAGVRLSPFTHGAGDSGGPWLPHQHAELRPNPGPEAVAALGASVPYRAPGRRALVASNDVLCDPELRAHPNLEASVVALASMDVRFAEIVFDGENDVLWVDAFPGLGEPDRVSWAARRLADLLHDPGE